MTNTMEPSLAVTAPVRVRLLAGLVAGPLYLAVSYAQALTRDGFDLTRNAFSYLSLGDTGWIQVANFVVAGALFVAGATAAGQILRSGPGRTWGPLLIGGLGVGMIGGGLFTVDPAFGYPAGAPAGTPEVLSWHGILHAASFAVAMLSWIAACFVFARRQARAGQRGWAAYSAVAGVLLLLPIGTVAAPPGALAIYAGASFSWIWTAALFAHLLADARR